MPPRRGPGNLEPSFPGATARPPTHHLGRGQHQDDESHLTRVLPPVLWANQPADAHVPLLQGLGGTAAGVGRARSTQLVATLGAGLPEPLTLTPPVTSLRERKRPNGTECPHPLPSEPGGVRLSRGEAGCGVLATHMMQIQDCWYCTPVAVAVTPWMVSDSRWAEAGVKGVRGSASLPP